MFVKVFNQQSMYLCFVYFFLTEKGGRGALRCWTCVDQIFVKCFVMQIYTRPNYYYFLFVCGQSGQWMAQGYRLRNT
jgi:hypothetical protein